MRIYPTNKSISYRISRYWWRKKAYLTLTGQLLLDLKTGESLPDKILWQQTYKDLIKIQTKQSFDKGRAKPRAEFLVGGYAYTYDDQTTETLVQVSVGSLKKQVQVFGDRYWVKSGPFHRCTKPLPFQQMALSWTNAFGGKAYTLNPDGKGLKETEKSTWPLPNVEDPKQLLQHPYQKACPIGFLARPLDRHRQQQLGTFDETWAKQAWPYLPDDHNFSFWNAASNDQQQQGFWRGDEYIRCIHMHPSKPIVEYQLANQKIRAFYQKKGQAPAEMPLAFDTIWLFPHLDQALLIWHGTIETLDETGHEIEAMLLAEENRQTGTLPPAHYFALLDDKIHRKPPKKVAEEPKPMVMPKSAVNSQLTENMAKAVEQGKATAAAAQTAKNNAMANLPPQHRALLEQAMAKMETTDLQSVTETSSEAPMANALQMVEKQLAHHSKAKELYQQFLKAEVKPPDFTKIRAQIEAVFAKHPNKDQLLEAMATVKDQLTVAEAAYLSAQQGNSASTTEEEKVAKSLKEKHLEHTFIADHCFKNMVFEEVLFKHNVFKNCRFINCRWLKCQFNTNTFDQCVFEQSDFTDCALSQFTLNHTKLLTSEFSQCVFDHVLCQNSEINNSLFKKNTIKLGVWQNNQWLACRFVHHTECLSHIKHNHFDHIVWQDSHFKTMAFSNCQFLQVECQKSQWHVANFTDCELKGNHWDSCHGSVLTFTQCQLSDISFKEVAIPKITIRKSALQDWQVLDSDFSQFSCHASSLQNINFSRSNLQNSRFNQLVLVDNMNFDRVNLNKSVFNHSSFHSLGINHCQLVQSMWKRCQIYQGQIKASTAKLSRFEDMLFDYGLLNNTNYFQASFKRSFFKNTEISDCNLVRANFYHASGEHLVMRKCLLPNPLPLGFWERWQEVQHG